MNIRLKKIKLPTLKATIKTGIRTIDRGSQSKSNIPAMAFMFGKSAGNSVFGNADILEVITWQSVNS